MPSQPAATPARKRAAQAPKARAAAKPVSTAPIKLYTDAPAAAGPMVPLFSIDDVDYLIPAEPDAMMALRYLDQIKNGVAQDTAMATLLEDLLGPEAYRGLLAFKGRMSPGQLAELFQAAQAAVVGLVEVPKGA